MPDTNGHSKGWAPAVAETNGGSKVDLARRELRRTAEQQWDIVSFLRYLQAFVPFASALTTVGATLICLGVSWGSLQFFRAHPYLLIIGAGLVCLAAGLAADPHGLLMWLPADLQDTLLKITIFDLVHDDAFVKNFSRKWGRVMMLCFTTSADDIETITEGMDPTFVHTIFKKTLIELVPDGVSRVLLPEHQELIPIEDTADAGNRQNTALAHWHNGEHAIQAVNRMHGDAKRRRSAPDAAPDRLTPVHISRMISERKEAIAQRVVEPSLDTVLASLYGPGTLVQKALCGVMPSRQALLKALQAASAFASVYWWGASSKLVRFPAAQAFLLRGFALAGMARGHSREALLDRSSRVASVFSVLSAGFGLALLGYSYRLEQLRKVSQARPAN